MNRLAIRTATKKDSLAFLRLLVGLAKFEHLEPPTRSAKKRIVHDIFEKKLNLFLATLNKKPVGYALYFYTYSSFLARPTLYLEDIFVSEKHRAMGIGSALFLKCAKEAMRQKCGRMEWSVLAWNKNAIRFYEKLGARRLKEWHYYRLDSDIISKLAKKARNN